MIKRTTPAEISWVWLSSGVVATTLLLIGGCQISSPARSPSTAVITHDTMMVRTELYFGLSRKNGGEISDSDFAAFVEKVVTPNFPDGLTIVDATGQWREESGKISHERSKILIVLHEPGARCEHAIEEIRSQYKSTFGQESVLRVTSTAGVAF